MPPTVVVVLALHEGMRHLEEQVQSIVGQGRGPDLVLLRDDRSTDGSGEHAARLLADAGVAYRLARNEERRGALGTFAALLKDAAGPAGDDGLVVLCDQDDAWLPDKLQRLMEALQSYPGADLVFSDGDVVDGASRPLGGSLWQHAGFTPAMRQRWDAGDALGVLMSRNVVTGASAAVRGRLLARALPLPDAGWHDAWLALVAAATSSCVALPDHLLRYRLHAGNTVGLQRPGTRAQLHASTRTSTADRARLLAGELDLFTTLEHRLLVLDADPAAVGRVGAKRSHLQVRLSLPRALPARAGAVARCWRSGDYRRYSQGLPSAVNDLARPLRLRVPL